MKVGPGAPRQTKTAMVCEAIHGVGTHTYTFNRQRNTSSHDNNAGFCEKEMILQSRCRKNNFLSRATQLSSEHVNDPLTLMWCSGPRGTADQGGTDERGGLLCLGEISGSTEIRRRRVIIHLFTTCPKEFAAPPATRCRNMALDEGWRVWQYIKT